MSEEIVKVHIDPETLFKDLTPQDHADISTMCVEQLCKKAVELKDLYEQLSKTYSVEMGIMNITCIVQISSPILPVTPVQGFFGTAEGIKNGLAKLATNGIKQLAKMSKEENADDKEQG